MAAPAAAAATASAAVRRGIRRKVATYNVQGAWSMVERREGGLYVCMYVVPTPPMLAPR